MTDSNHRDWFEEFAPELDTPRADGLAAFALELSTDESDAPATATAAAEPRPREERTTASANPHAASSSSTTEGVEARRISRRPHGSGFLASATGIGLVVAAAGFASYLLVPRTIVGDVQAPLPGETARNDRTTASGTSPRTDSGPHEPPAKRAGGGATIADETNQQTEASIADSQAAVRQRDPQRAITPIEALGGSETAEEPARSATARGIAPRSDRTAEKAQTEPAQRDATGDRPSKNLTGWWTLTNQVHATSYQQYRGLRLVYHLRLQQAGNRISGHGQKWAENGRPLSRAGRTPIEVSGTIQGRRLMLRFTEQGLRRVSGGAFELTVMDDGQMSGTFHSDVAQSTGSSVAQRGGGPQEGQL
jgi:hypothetical protein